MFGLTENQLDAIYDWLNTETGLEVIFVGQSNVRPSKPFIVVNVPSPPKADALRPDKLRDGSTDVIVKFHKSFTLSIAAVSDSDAGIVVCSVEESVFKKDIKNMLNEVGLYCRHCLGSTNTNKELVNRFEYISTIDFRFGVTSTFVEKRDIIESVEIEYDNT